MTKKLSRAELKMNRDVSNKIKDDANANKVPFYWQGSNPIFIPRRKKKK